MNAARFLVRWILRLALFGLLLLAFLMALAYFALQRDPNGFAERHLSEISAKTGLEFSFGAIDVNILPLPSISISDFSAKNAKMSFTAGWISAQPNFFLLMRGILFPGKIVMLRPKFLAETELPLDDPAALRRHFSNKSKGGGGGLNLAAEYGNIVQGSCEIEIRQGEANVRGRENSSLGLHAFQCALSVNPDGDMAGNLRLAALRMLRNKDAVFNLENFTLAGEANPLNFLFDTPELKTSGNIRYKGIISTASFNIDFESSTLNRNGSIDLDMDLDLDGEIIPFSLEGRAMELERGGQIVFRGLQWRLGADSGSLDATLKLPRSNKSFELSGILLAHRASLSQWLGFARNLPPGLQLALDNVLDGRIEFKIDSKGLLAPSVEAVCVGARFSGKGSVADFAKPVVFLDLKSKFANLGLALPESLGIAPMPPWFSHEALTPKTASPLKPGEVGIDYDIRLAAENLKYGTVKITNASLRIYPGKMDKIGIADVLLSGKGAFYGGQIKGDCILGVDASLPYAITASAKNINAARLCRDMPVLPLKQGILSGKANVSSKSKKLDVFLANLRGSADVACEKAVLSAAEKLLLSSFSASVDLKGARLENNRLGVNGQWKSSAKTAEFNCDASLEGRLWFGGRQKEMSFENLPTRINFSLNEKLGALPDGAKGSVKGDMSFASGQGKAVFKNASYTFLNLSGKLNADVEMNKKAAGWKGNFSAGADSLAKTIGMLGGAENILPAAWRKFDISANFQGGGDSLKLSGIKARLGANLITGRLSWEKRGGKPFFDVALKTDKLDMALFDNPAKKPTAKKSAWNFSYMRSFNARGELDANQVRGWNVSLSNFRFPFNLDDGRLSVGPARARLYGGAVNWRAKIDFRHGVAFDGVMSAHDFDLGAASRDRKIKSILTGKTNLDASIRLKLTGPGQIARALNGEWSFSIRDGSWQGRDKNGKLEGKPTRFNLASASGVVNSGLFKSGNLLLRGPNMRVDGSGWLNLAEQKVDCDFNVNMKGLPDFPLRLYGSLDNTKTSIGAGKMVINAIGGITNGVIDVLGGIAEGAWKIFR